MKKLGRNHKYHQWIKNSGRHILQLSNHLGCPCEATFGWLLLSKSCLHSDLFMSTLVKWSEIQMKFLDKVYWFWIRNWLCAFLIIKRNFCFEILWKYSYLINILLIKKPEFYQKLGLRIQMNLKEVTSINGFKIR